MTDEQRRISNRNRNKAKAHYSIERYILWDPEDLQLLSLAEHIRVHNLERKGIRNER